MPQSRRHFRAGYAAVDITPDPAAGRVELSGYAARTQPATGVRDRLSATVLALGADGAEPVLVVGLDLCILDAEAASRIAGACPLPERRVVLCCSHSHAAPATYPLLGCGTPDPAYVRRVAVQVGNASRRAMAEAVPCRLGWGRRALDPALVRWHNRRDPAGGAVDPRLTLLKVERSASTRVPVCGLWSLACHPVCLGSDNRSVSADWVGVVRSALPWPSVFAQGFCGDQNPRERGEAAMGAWADMAEAIVALWDATPTSSSGPLAWERRELALPRLPGDPAGSAPAPPGWAEGVARPGAEAPSSPAEVGALRVGNGRAVFWPGEPHIAHALGLAADTLGVGHAGPSVGYVPEREAYPRGGYEVGSAHRYYGFASALAPEAGEALRAASGELLRESG